MEISYKTALYRSAITIIAPAVMLTSFIYHPHVGNPIDADFLEKLAAAGNKHCCRRDIAYSDPKDDQSRPQKHTHGTGL